MTQQSVIHSTFVIERSYPTTPERVFAAFADPAKKRRWFAEGEGFAVKEFKMDFRVGGKEHSRFHIGAGPHQGTACANDTVYQDIVPNERIVSTYDMHMDETRTSVSLATVEFKPDGAQTRLIFTEQGVFFDGHDNAAERERGTRELLNNLDAALRRES